MGEDELRAAADEDAPKRVASALPEGFFDDPRAQQAVEEELTKEALARKAADAARAPASASSSSTPLSVPVVSAVECVR